MSATGLCPSCGNQLLFRAATTTTVVCEFCRSIVVRGGAQLELVGKTNEILATGSVLKLGLEGSVRGKRFTLVGRLQSRHELGGLWDEWLVAFADGKLAWLAEHQGRFALTTEVNPAEAPFLTGPDAVKPGQTFVTGIGELIVVERGEAVLVSEEGELPGRSLPGARRPFIDFTTRNGRFATLDFGTIGVDGFREPRRFYVGREVTLADLGLEAAAVQPVVVGHAEGAHTLRCPHCGAPVEKKLTEAESLTCSSCGSALSVEQDGQLGFLFAQEKLHHTPRIPVGRTARLDAGFFRKASGPAGGTRPWPQPLDVEVVACVVRSVLVDGERYTFQEHLLHTEKSGFFWLIESDGEWLFARNVDAGRVSVQGRTALFDGRRFNLTDQNVARVEQVTGELYFRVTKGEVSALTDYKSYPRVLSLEETDDEHIWTECLMIEPGEVARCFRVTPPGPPAYASGGSTSGGGEVTPAGCLALFIIVFVLFLLVSMCGTAGASSSSGGHYSSRGGGSSFGK